MPPKRNAVPRPPVPATVAAPITAHGILIRPRTAEEIEKPEYDGVCAELLVAQVPVSMFNSLPWEPSPISTALGVPIKVTRWQSDRGRINEGALGLFMHADPEQNDFGKVKYQWVDGAVLVSKADGGGNVEVREVQALLCYLSELSQEVAAFLRSGQDDHVARAKELAGRRITPAAFKEFMKTFRQ